MNYETEDKVWEIHWYNGDAARGGVSRETPDAVAIMHAEAEARDEQPEGVRAWRRDYQHLYGVVGQEQRTREAATSRQQPGGGATEACAANVANAAAASGTAKRHQLHRDGGAAAPRPATHNTQTSSPERAKLKVSTGNTPTFATSSSSYHRQRGAVGAGALNFDKEFERRDERRDRARDQHGPDRGGEKVRGGSQAGDLYYKHGEWKGHRASRGEGLEYERRPQQLGRGGEVHYHNTQASSQATTHYNPNKSTHSIPIRL